MQKILTVSIAAYNVENYIEKCLESLVNPEILDDLEVLVVDDGSKDATSQIAKKFSEKYPQTFKYINKENGGWGSTVNTGIRHASGKYFKLLDGDDYFITAHLSDYIDFLRRGETVDLVLTPYNIYYEKKERVDMGTEWKKFQEGQIYEYEYIAKDCFVGSMPEMTVRTELLKENSIEIMEHCFYTDVQFRIETCSMVRTLTFFNKPVYLYRIGREGQSCCKEGFLKHHEDLKCVVIQCINFMSAHKNMPKNVRSACIVRINLLIEKLYDVYRLFPKDVRNSYLIEWDKELKNDYTDYYKKSGKQTFVNRFFRFKFTGAIFVAFECYHALHRWALLLKKCFKNSLI